jgi:hypothetical protein
MRAGFKRTWQSKALILSRYVYELIDGAGQTAAIYSNEEAANEHAEDAYKKKRSDFDVTEREVHDEYIPDGHDWRR